MKTDIVSRAHVQRMVLIILVCLFGSRTSLPADEKSDIVRKGVIVIEAGGETPEQPVFHTATSEATVDLTTKAIEVRIDVSVRVLQGDAETLSLGLAGSGDVTEVVSDSLMSWSIRQSGDKRFLDLEVKEGTEQLRAVVQIQTSIDDLPTTIDVPHLSLGEAIGLDSLITINPSVEVKAITVEASGFVSLESAGQTERFRSATGGVLKLSIARSSAAPQPVELSETSLIGSVTEDGKSVLFVLKATAVVSEADAVIDVLSGNAAVSDMPSEDGFRLGLHHDENRPVYRLAFPETGTFPFQIDFVASVSQTEGNGSELDFIVASGAVVPLSLDGLGPDLTFTQDSGWISPQFEENVWRGFLPASGRTQLRWKATRQTGDGKLFFTTHGKVEANVGAGLLRQDHTIDYRVLQGELKSIRMQINGPGEITDVQGNDLVGWKTVEDDGVSFLDVTLNRSIVGASQIRVRSQSPLGEFPVRVEAMRLEPVGAIRHSGFLRLSNSGSVRLEPIELNGLTQMAPDQFPGDAIETRQVFVYRFPSAEHSLTILADRIQPEVNVSEVVQYEIAETDRTIIANVELDIREASIRDWDVRVPADYSVVSVTGASVADYVTGSEVVEDRRNLKVMFTGDVIGRQLVVLHLEKNQVAEAGAWALPAIEYVNAKSVRGDIGVTASPGFRTSVVSSESLLEKPLSYFPNPNVNLQHAFRIRTPDWSATMQIEPLDQSVQADVFHLYSLREGNVYGSALVNYFVTGAPVAQWRLNVPESLGNVMVDGQGIRTWRRDGDILIVSLHQPVMGPATLLVTFEQRPDAAKGTVAAGAVMPLDVQSERGYVQVVSPVQVEVNTLSISDDMLVLDPLELPAEFRLLSSAPSMGTWQYTERPFGLILQIKWFEPGTMVDQVVEFAEANSRVSKDGELVTDVTYFVKSRARRTLAIRLPGDPVRLWAVAVNGQPVTARQSAEETLIPLPGGSDPNAPVQVSLRLGKPTISEASAELTLPVVMAPVLKTQWSIRGDEQRVLVPTGGTVTPPREVVRPSGFEWVARNGWISLVLIGVFALASVLVGQGTGFWQGISAVCVVIAFSIALITAASAYASAGTISELNLNVPILASGETVSLNVHNVPLWRVDWSWSGAIVFIIGAVGFAWSFVASRERTPTSVWFLARVAGLLLIGLGILMQGASASLFFFALAIGIFAWLLVPGFGSMLRGFAERRRERDVKTPADDKGSSSAGVVPGIVLGILCGLSGFASTCVAEKPAPESVQEQWSSADSLVQQWAIVTEDDRLTATATMTVSGRVGDQFLLLKSPATLTAFTGEGLRLTKTEVPGIGFVYVVTIAASAQETNAEEAVAEISEEPDTEPIKKREETLRLQAKFEYRLDVKEIQQGVAVPTGAAAVSEIEVQVDQTGWEVSSPAAVRVRYLENTKPENNAPENELTRANVLLGPGAANLLLKPKARDVTSEQTRFYVETSNLYRPGPGVVDGRHRLQIRPAQGQVGELELSVPEGLTVREVSGPVGAWQFDADQGQLRLQIEPAQSTAFEITVDTQRSLDVLPTEVVLSPMKVAAASGEVGLLAIAFGSDAQPETSQVEKMSAVNLSDFDAGLMMAESDVLHRVYRYDAEGGQVTVRVVPVEPEVRVVTRQALSLGDERVVLNVNAVVEITRAGLFQLSFPLPGGFEVESLTGPGLHHWAESNEGDRRQVILHLNGKTIGQQVFSIVLSGDSPTNVSNDAANADARGVALDEPGQWSVPRFEISEAMRQTGELVVRPATGIRLRTVSRQNVSETDPRTMGNPSQANTTGGLAFRLLQRDWNLTLGIDQLEPWVTGKVLHDLTIREGQTRSTVIAEFEIENASIGTLDVVLPITNADEIKTLRASGTAVSDLVRKGPDSDTWELSFQRRVFGKVEFRIEYERRGMRENDAEALVPVKFPQARQIAYFYGVRAGGRLEIQHDRLPEGWQRVDWTTIPQSLRESETRTSPSLALRAVSPVLPLTVRATRHSLADALKLRVAEGTLTTVLSPTGDQLTAVEMTVEVIQRSSLSLGLPMGGDLFSVFVNGESVHSIRQEGDSPAWQFTILPGMDDRTAEVRFVYSVPVAPGSRRGLRGLRLQSPELNVPLENIRWNVIAPDGFELDDADGDLELVKRQRRGSYDRSSYLSLMSGKRSNQARQATEMLDQANELLQAGEQSKARWALSNVANQFALDAASNEDARVQLENLQTQQAVVGLNTRRQRLYLDNYRDDVSPVGDEQMRRAAADNPVLQQDELNFRPQQLSELLRGNTTEDNAVLQEIACRLVQHQSTTETVPQAILISLPEEGTVYEFRRTVQVNENAALELDLQFHRRDEIGWGRVLGLLTLLTICAGAFVLYGSRIEV